VECLGGGADYSADGHVVRRDAIIVLSALSKCFVASRTEKDPSAPPLEPASVSSDRSAQNRSKAKLDEVVHTPVATLSGRAASRATNAYAVRAVENVLTH
jgi:hypothetical protein